LSVREKEIRCREVARVSQGAQALHPIINLQYSILNTMRRQRTEEKGRENANIERRTSNVEPKRKKRGRKKFEQEQTEGTG
jgi:hypothetical protein